MNVYTVQAGDTLETIAKKFLVSVTDLQKWNNGQFPSLYSTTLPMTPGWVINVSPPSRTTYNVTDFGAIGHDITRNDGSVIAGSTSFVSKDGTFKSGDVGTNITVDYAATNTTLSDMLIQGASYSLLTVNPLTTEIASGANVVVQFGTYTQTFVAAAAAPVGAIYITVNAQTANYSYPIGSYVDPANLTTTIRSVSSPTLITLGADATITAYGLTYTYTPDDTAAIDSARSACKNAGGGIVFYPPGTYLRSGSATLYSGVYDVGAGKGVTKILATSTLAAPLFAATIPSGGTIHNLGVRDMTIDGNTGPTGTIDGISLDTSSSSNIVYRNILMSGVTFVNCRNGWVHAANNANAGPMYNETYLSNCSFSNCYIGAIIGGTYGSTFTNCFSYQCTEAALATSAYANFSMGGSGPTTFIRVSGFHVEGLGNLTGSGTATENGIECECSESSFTGLSLSNISQIPITVTTAEAEDNIISDTRIYGCGYYGIAVGSSAGANSGGRITDVVMVDVLNNTHVTLDCAVDISQGSWTLRNTKIIQTVGNASFIGYSGAVGRVVIDNVDVDTYTGEFVAFDSNNPPSYIKISNCPGYNPTGPQSAPSMPASGTALTNPFPFDTTVYISGGTVTAIDVGGTSTGLTSGSVFVPAGETITLTYSSAPTWVWIGN